MSRKIVANRATSAYANGLDAALQSGGELLEALTGTMQTKEWGSQPPRLLFGAPSRRTPCA
jgi:hypothetical protein